jgi:hypothetical protein
MPSAQSTKRGRLSPVDNDEPARLLSQESAQELARLLTRAFPDDAKTKHALYSEARANPGLAEELLRAAQLSAAGGDLKDAVELAYELWKDRQNQAEEAARQRQNQAEVVIKQLADPAMPLYNDALELVQTDPGFVNLVLRLPTDNRRSSLQALARGVDGEAALPIQGGMGVADMRC